MGTSTKILLKRDRMVEELRRMGVYGSVIHMHRSMAAFKLPTESLINFLGIPIIFVLLCFVAFPYMTDFWTEIFIFAHSFFKFPGEVNVTSYEVFPYYYLDLPSFTMNAGWPSTLHLIISASFVIVLFLITLLFPDRLIPLAYLFRAVCAIQTTAILYFAVFSPPFPYSLTGYTGCLMRAEIIIISLTPILFAFTLYVFKMSLFQKILVSLMTIGHLAVFIPLQMLVHIYLIKMFSFIAMPVLFFMFGLIITVFIIIGFYSWGVSRVDVTQSGL
ncbi:MAG: hypothetical protein JXA41_12565 [Deltaproteobacteria bacterium]|nr:hypothetical protein [Deltaproteobacteria bacterium]